MKLQLAIFLVAALVAPSHAFAYGGRRTAAPPNRGITDPADETTKAPNGGKTTNGETGDKTTTKGHGGSTDESTTATFVDTTTAGGNGDKTTTPELWTTTGSTSVSGDTTTPGGSATTSGSGDSSTTLATGAGTGTGTGTGNRNICDRLEPNGETCDFFECFFSSQSCADESEAPSYEELVSLCESSLDSPAAFDAQGQKYIEDYRKCQQERLLPAGTGASCQVINDLAAGIVVTPDPLWDCLYQNGTLCDILSSDQNALALATALGSSMPAGRLFSPMMQKVNFNCDAAGRNGMMKMFTGNFLREMQSNMMMMMGMGIGGGDK